jgi:uncharacterized protein (DUF885 family)
MKSTPKALLSRPAFFFAPLAMGLVLLSLCILTRNACCAPAAPKPGASQQLNAGAGSLENFIRVYTQDLESLERFYELPWSPARSTRLQALFEQWQGNLAGVDFEALSQEGRIDYLLLRNKLEHERARLSLGRRRLTEMDELLPFRESIQTLERARWQLKPIDAQASASKVAAVVDDIKALRKRLEKGKRKKDEKTKRTDAKPDQASEGESAKEKSDSDTAEVVPLKISPVLAKRAAAAVGEIRGTLKTWFSFYDGYQPDFSWWLKKPYDDAAKALEDYSKFLREELAGLKDKEEDPLIGDPVGAAGLTEDLAAEMIPYTPEELIGIGEQEFAWCEARLKEAAKKMGLGQDWKTALAKVKADFAPPGKQDELVVEEARRAIKFVKDHELVTIPPLCEETWRLTMISPEGQKTMPYVAYNGQNMMVAYAKEEMKHDDKLMSMRGNNRHFTHITTAHELIPGHHLQHFVGSRNRSYRSIFTTPFLVEGWSLYWEMLLWDLNYARNPEDRIGMLFWRMHRAARIIVSLKFHLGQMTPAEMIDFLVERVGHERLGATSEVRRFIGDSYSPLYQCAYMIGGLQLRALHHELVGAHKMSDRQFHDAVLACNAIPVEFIRAGLLNLPLRRETRSGWRFADVK